jgi:hypothetical protein
MKRISMALIPVGALVFLVLWLLRPTDGIPEIPNPSTKPALASQEASMAQDSSKVAIHSSSGGPASSSAKAAEPKESPALSPQPKAKAGPPGGHLDRLRYLQGISGGQGEAAGQEAIRRTAVHLSIDPVRVSEFQAAARQSVLEMEQALDVRKRELSSSSHAPGGSVPSEQERLSQERYASARAKALERLERFLVQDPVHREFRWEFDSWASMVAQKAQVANR